MSDELFPLGPYQEQPSSRRQKRPRTIPIRPAAAVPPSEPFVVNTRTGPTPWTTADAEEWATRLAATVWAWIEDYFDRMDERSALHQSPLVTLPASHTAPGNTNAFPVDAYALERCQSWANDEVVAHVVGEENYPTFAGDTGDVLVAFDGPDGTIQGLTQKVGWAVVLLVFTFDQHGRARWRCGVVIDAGGKSVVFDRSEVRRTRVKDFWPRATPPTKPRDIDSAAVREALSRGGLEHRPTKDPGPVPVVFNAVASSFAKFVALASLAPVMAALEVDQVAIQAGSPAVGRIFSGADQLWYSRKGTRPCDGIPLLLATHPRIRRGTWLIESGSPARFEELIELMETDRVNERLFGPYTIATSNDRARDLAQRLAAVDQRAS
jgi:hypothetical protein